MEAHHAAQHARDRTVSTQAELAELHQRVDALSLACTALWELLSEHTGVGEKELIAKIEELDLCDGVLDNKLAASASECPQCTRANRPSRSMCLYCGAKLTQGRPFP